MRFLDTNPFVRAITNDHPDHSPRSRALFVRLATEQEEATTCEAVIAEVVYVLSSRTLYTFKRVDIQQLFSAYLSIRGLRLPDKDTYLRALRIFAESNMHFVDCLLVAHAEAEDDDHVVISYDRDFDRVPGIRREEP